MSVETIYVGRLVMVGLTPDGRWCAGYRVSSRSFPNRRAVVNGPAATVSIVPKPGFESDIHKNPYIAYNCVRIVCGGAVAIASNGSQTDPVSEKVAAGMPVRDALVLSLLALDYEKDHLNTPRICAVADKRGPGAGWLAVVRHDGVEAVQVALEPGQCAYVATYETNTVAPGQREVLAATTADDVCTALFDTGVFGRMTHPVTAVAAVAAGDTFELAARDKQGG